MARKLSWGPVIGVAAERSLRHKLAPLSSNSGRRAPGATTAAVNSPASGLPTATAAPERWFALIDMNSYFATLEQQANPFLRGKPVGILKEQGRSCVIAASQEAKALGVQTGESLRDARHKAPDLITVAADFDKYFHNTKRLHHIFTHLSPDVDLFSLDEAFLELTSCRRLYPDAATFFAHSRRQVQAELGEWVTFSVGFGRNRLQAKLASELAGKNHYFEITPDNLPGILMDTKVEELCGIGFRLAHRLHCLGITHVYQLNFTDDHFLHQHFGPFWAKQLRLMGQGQENHLLAHCAVELPHMKSVSRSKTLFVPSADPYYLEQLLYNLAEDMCFKARRMGLAGRQLGFSLRDINGQHWGQHQQLHGRWVAQTQEVFTLLQQLFWQRFQPAARTVTHALSTPPQPRRPRQLPVPIIKAGVWLGDLTPTAHLTPSWLPANERQTRLWAAIDQVNEKHGLFTVKPGKLLNFQLIRPEVTGYLGDRSYQLQFAS